MDDLGEFGQMMLDELVLIRCGDAVNPCIQDVIGEVCW